MAEVQVLITGYAGEENGIEKASCTTTLIKDDGRNIIVDPGMDRERLLSALNEAGISIDEIDLVFLTHYHFDHSLLAAVFHKAEIAYVNEVYDQQGRIFEGKKIFSDAVEIIKTPGHNSDNCTLLVQTKDGIAAVCGDVFWWGDDEKQELSKDALLEKNDIYATDNIALRRSREKILNRADIVIPGHGQMFKIKK